MIEGAENFDFFRQPDFIKDPLLAGSYAVYKKEILLGEGTGKLCHIHRPEIIDARGRRCWGELSITGNRLNITIPEKWLGEAKYPVIVDPTVGTTTVGSLSKHVFDVGEDPETLFVELAVAVNRFLVPESINGLCTGFAYVNEDDSDGGGRPVFYSDNGNVPSVRKSTQEAFINMRVNSGNPTGWRSAAFMSNESIASGSYIWFGIFSDCFWFPRFDYGSKCYWEMWCYDYDDIPDAYPIRKVNNYENFKLSMYFTYTSAQNYVRVLTQGISLTDSRRLTADYKRNIVQAVQANSNITKLQSIYRKLKEAVQGFDNYNYTALYLRSMIETAAAKDTIRYSGSFFRMLMDCIEAESKLRPGWVIYLKISDSVRVLGTVFRGLVLFVRIVTGLYIRDFLLVRFLKARQELILKSCISREIILDSKIN